LIKFNFFLKIAQSASGVIQSGGGGNLSGIGLSGLILDWLSGSGVLRDQLGSSGL